jgi:hypothetical protein
MVTRWEKPLRMVGGEDPGRYRREGNENAGREKGEREQRNALDDLSGSSSNLLALSLGVVCIIRVGQQALLSVSGGGEKLGAPYWGFWGDMSCAV